MENSDLNKNQNSSITISEKSTIPSDISGENSKSINLFPNNNAFPSLGQLNENNDPLAQMKQFEEITLADLNLGKEKFSKTSILNEYYEFEPKINTKKHSKGDVSIITLKSGKKIVLKTFVLNQNDTKNIDYLLREFYISKTFGYVIENVAKALNIKQIPIEEGKKMYIEILYEYGGIDLLNSINTITSKRELYDIVYQLVCVLEIMEDIGIAHLDIKPQNIVYEKSTSLIKLIDFGASISFFRSPQAIINLIGDYQDKFHSFTVLYSPPETLLLNKLKWPKNKKWNIIPQKVDSFCFGITIIELIYRVLFKLDFNEIRDGDEKSHDLFRNKIEAAFKEHDESKIYDIIKDCLSYSPDKRPTFKELKLKFENLLKSFGYDDVISLRSKKSTLDFHSFAKMCFNLGEYETLVYHCKRYNSGLIESPTKHSLYENAYILLLQGFAYLKLGEFQSCVETLNNSVIQLDSLKFPA